jgi:hypothetical protein
MLDPAPRRASARPSRAVAIGIACAQRARLCGVWSGQARARVCVRMRALAFAPLCPRTREGRARSRRRARSGRRANLQGSKGGAHAKSSRTSRAAAAVAYHAIAHRTADGRGQVDHPAGQGVVLGRGDGEERRDGGHHRRPHRPRHSGTPPPPSTPSPASVAPPRSPPADACALPDAAAVLAAAEAAAPVATAMKVLARRMGASSSERSEAEFVRGRVHTPGAIRRASEAVFTS